MKVKIRLKKTFVFNQRGCENPEALIYVNCCSLADALHACKAYSPNLDIDLVDCYVFTKQPPRRYIEIPEIIFTVRYNNET